jgi:membrane-bound ClpP family serine protease
VKKFLPLLGMILLISGFSVAQMQNENARTVLVAELRGTIDPASASYLEMALREAELKKAQALIVELDTPGG